MPGIEGSYSTTADIFTTEERSVINVAYPKCQLKDEPLKRIELLVRKLNAIRGKSITYSLATEGLDSTKLLEVAEKKSSHGRRKGKVRTP